MKSLLFNIASAYNTFSININRVQPLALLTARLYVAWAFFASGLTKLRDWDSTLFLFEEEYSVPLLNPEFAAYLATSGEIILPILLIAGLASRFSAMGISIINAVAVISLEEIGLLALYGHIVWGLLLMLIILWGAGKISADEIVANKLALKKV